MMVAIEMKDELLRDNLTRKQLAERHSITSDRMTQWLCLLKLPEEMQREIEALGEFSPRGQLCLCGNRLSAASSLLHNDHSPQLTPCD